MSLFQTTRAIVGLAVWLGAVPAALSEQVCDGRSCPAKTKGYLASHPAGTAARAEHLIKSNVFVLAQSGMPADMEALRVRAEKGDPAAQLALGTAFALGRDVERDEQRAVSWLTQAAEAGNITAQYNLGILHVAHGAFADAYHWFVIVAEHGRGEIQTKATRNRQLLSMVMMIDDLKVAKRDAGDWIEEFAPNPDANSAADQELELIGLPVPRVGGWRQKAAALQNAARDSLGMPH